MRAATASLDPTEFRHEAPERVGRLTIGQVDHPIQIRNVGEMHIPCACGRPLVGLETELIADPLGYALYFLGVCLTCGRQSGIYISAPITHATQATRDAQLHADVTALVEQVGIMRASGPRDEDVMAETINNTDKEEKIA